MAKPIRATPKLTREESERFLKDMILVENSKINKIDRELAQKVETNSKFFEVAQHL